MVDSLVGSEEEKERKKGKYSARTLCLCFKTQKDQVVGTQEQKRALSYQQSQEGVLGRRASLQGSQVEGRATIAIWDRLPGGSAEPGRRSSLAGEESPFPFLVSILILDLPCRGWNSVSVGHIRLEALNQNQETCSRVLVLIPKHAIILSKSLHFSDSWAQ